MTKPKVRLPDGERKAIAMMIMLGVFAMLLAVGVSMWYTARTDDRAEQRTNAAIKAAEQRQAEDLRRWCDLLRSLDDRNATLPPSADEETNKFRRQIHDLRTGYGC